MLDFSILSLCFPHRTKHIQNYHGCHQRAFNGELDVVEGNENASGMGSSVLSLEGEGSGGEHGLTAGEFFDRLGVYVACVSTIVYFTYGTGAEVGAFFCVFVG